MMLSSDDAGESALPNTGHTDEAEPSIDSIISWLRQQRDLMPDVPLRKLIGDKQIAKEGLVDVACIDLIQQRRAGQAITVEDYLRDFPQLSDDGSRLDLIDAEICIDRELGKTPALDPLAQRFPDLHAQIADLLQMAPIAGDDLALISASQQEQSSNSKATGVVDQSKEPSMSLMVASPSDGESMDFSIAEPLEQKGKPASEAHPVDAPEWFVGERCVASGPGHWLVRGRDAERGETLAMKVIELPVQISHAQVQQLMDACEQAAKVRNPAWVLPAVAAVQDRHLAVIRHWVFANPWQHGSRVADPAGRLRQLSLVAYALQSAHDVGAAHGGLHASNLFVDHIGKIQLVDGSSSRALVKSWLETKEGFAGAARRQQIDAQDLIKLVVTDAVDWADGWADGLVSQLRSIANANPAEACGRIGDALIRWADGHSVQVPKRTGATKQCAAGFRQRLAQWITRR